MTNLTIPDTEAIKFTIGADIAKGISSIELITELTAPLPERPPKFEIRIYKNTIKPEIFCSKVNLKSLGYFKFSGGVKSRSSIVNLSVVFLGIMCGYTSTPYV